jgi:hypothetical protein
LGASDDFFFGMGILDYSRSEKSLLWALTSRGRDWLRHWWLYSK